MREQLDQQRPSADAPGLISFPNRMSTYPVLSDTYLERFLGIQAINGHIVRPKGYTLFSEGEAVLGVHVIRDGRVKLSIGSDEGRSLILGLVGRGTVLGLPGSVLGLPHAVTARVVKSAKLSFICRDDVLRHLHATEAAAFAAAEMVSAIYYSAIAELATIQLSQSAEQKVARFLLGLYAMSESAKPQVQVTLEASQEEIGQMVGISRETVARVMSRFKKRHIVDLVSSTLVIHDKNVLVKLAEL